MYPRAMPTLAEDLQVPGQRPVIEADEDAAFPAAPREHRVVETSSGRSSGSPTRATSSVSPPAALCRWMAVHRGPRRFSSSRKRIAMDQFVVLVVSHSRRAWTSRCSPIAQADSSRSRISDRSASIRARYFQ